MNASRLATLALRHAARLRTPAIALAVAALCATACAIPGVGKSASTGHDCPDKLVKELSTNVAVSGLWNCLNPTLQDTLHAYGRDGDGALLTPGVDPPQPGAIVIKYAATQNGVVIYTAVLKSSDATKPAQTLVVVVWTDGKGLISNFTIAGPAL